MKSRGKGAPNQHGEFMRVKTAADHLLFMTVRICTAQSIGTGFIFEHKWNSPKESTELTGMFLVTNKHVIANATHGNFRMTRSAKNGDLTLKLGRPIQVSVGTREWRWWMGHPDKNVDVAVLPLNPLFQRLKDNGTIPFYSCVSANILPDSDALAELNPIEDVVFVGYPNNVFDCVNNLPIVRRGITATPPNVDHNGNPTFLIDASVFPGSSGSPVFIYNAGSWLERTGGVLGSERILFLGLISSVLYRESNGSLEFREIPTGIHPVPVNREMIDLGIVYKASTVIETIEHLLRSFQEM